MGLNALSESIGDEDILGSNSTASRGKKINSRKRKLDRVGDLEEPITRRKRRPAQNRREGGNVALQRDRTRKPKSTTTAASRDTLAHMGDTSPDDGTTNDSQATSRVETVKVRNLGTKNHRKIVDSAAKAGRGPKAHQQPVKLSKERDGNPEEKDLVIEAKPAANLVDHEVTDEQEPAAEEMAPAITPVKKQRKRKPVARRLSKKRARQPTHASPQKTVSSRSNHSTSDLINELLDSTITSSPQKPSKEPEQARNIVKSSKAMPSTNSRRPALNGPDLAVEGSDLTKSTSIVSKPATAEPEQTAEPKPRKRGRSTTQNKKPRKRVAVETNPEDEVRLRASEVNAESNHVTIASNTDTKTMGNHTGRSPLSNITNSIPDPVVARAKPESTGNSTQDPAAVKKKGRPRRNLTTDKNERSKSQPTIAKPDTKATSAATALPTKPRTTLNKTAKAPAKPIKAPKSSTSVVTVNASTSALVDDPALDSDDPLSGPSNVRFKKSFKKPADGFARVSSSENIQLTPQRKHSENSKRKELEQEEIEMLLSSIGKGVRSGRAMAA